MKNLFAFGFSLLLFTARSQAPWDLQQCINYAIAHNISLQQTSMINQQNKNIEQQSKAAVLPSVNAGVTHQYNFGQTIDRFTNTFANTEVLSQNFYLSSSLVLWNGLTEYNTIKYNQYTYLSGVEKLKQQQYDLSLNVANAYINVIFSDELLKIAKSQYDVSQEQMERTQKLVDAGAAAKSVGYDIKAQLANDQVNLTTADNNYYLALLSLRQLMNLDSVRNFSVVRPDLSIQEAQLLEDNVQYVYENSLRSQPSIKSGEYSIMSAEKYLAVMRGRISPSLTFNASMGTGTSGLAKDIIGSQITGSQPIGVTSDGVVVYAPVVSYQTRKTPFADQFKNNANKILSFTLNVPIFNGLQTNTNIKNAKLSAYNAKLAQDLNKQNLYKSIAQAHANAKASLNKYNATKASAEAAAESFKYAQEKLNAGAMSAIDFSTAKNRLFAAESNMLQAKYDYVFKLKVLDYYQGKPLGF